MTASEERVRTLVTQQAADWFIANRAGLSARERDTFTAWLRASPLHVEEYLALAVIARDLPKASEESHGALDELLARARLEEGAASVERLWPRILAAVEAVAAGRRWQHAAVTLAAVAVVSLAGVLWWSLEPIPRSAAPADVTVLHFETRHGELRTEHLADDSVLHLNTDSAATVRYGGKQRVVELTAGEADFEVVHEPARPFRVFAGSAQVVDLGTKFDVRLNPQSTVVTVVEGRVGVSLSSLAAGGGASPGAERAARPPTVELGANQQITVAANEWPAAPVTVDSQRSTAWLHRQISFDHEPLERVAQEFNRYSPKPIEITTPELRKLEISGVFSTDDTEAFIAFLRSLQGVHVEVSATRIRVSKD